MLEGRDNLVDFRLSLRGVGYYLLMPASVAAPGEAEWLLGNIVQMPRMTHEPAENPAHRPIVAFGFKRNKHGSYGRPGRKGEGAKDG